MVFEKKDCQGTEKVMKKIVYLDLWHQIANQSFNQVANQIKDPAWSQIMGYWTRDYNRIQSFLIYNHEDANYYDKGSNSEKNLSKVSTRIP